MVRRTFITILVVLCSISALAPVSAGAVSRKPRCVATRAPKTTHKYTTERIAITVAFELKGCRRGDSFDYGFMLVQDGIVMGQGMAGGGACFGHHMRRCITRFGLPHDPIERSTYSLEVDYRSSAGEETLKAEYVCTSAVVTASCE
jgi:hypothetical protein